MKSFFLLLLITASLSSCEQKDAPIKSSQSQQEKVEKPKPEPVIDYSKTIIENRDSILYQLDQKINNKIPLVVHVMVPLCDNENQGIIPTSASLGNGLDLKRNLYWATSKGMKRFFNELPDWKLLVSHLDYNDVILERVIFKKKYSNDAIVYLVADAYRGDKMENCLNDHFNSLAGALKDSAVIEGVKIGINGNADLIAFNGHNGLMDEVTSHSKSVDGRQRDAVSISCSSRGYFKEEYITTHSYPLVVTTNLLYPGAFVLEGIINEWALLKSDEQCKVGAGKGYYKHKPKSGPNGSQNLFDHGW